MRGGGWVGFLVQNIDATYYHAQQEHPDKGCAIKMLFVCNDGWDPERLNLLTEGYDSV